MRHILSIFLLLAISLSCTGQTFAFDIDYRVDYILNNERQSTIDTLTVGFEKNGRYIWSNSDILSNQFTGGLLRSNDPIGDTGESHIIYDTEEGQVFMVVKNDNFNIMMNMDLESIMPSTGLSQISKNTKIEGLKTSGKKKILNKELPVFVIKTEGSSFLATFDDSYVMDNNSMLQNFLNIMLRASNSDGNITSDVPKGLIMNVSDNNKTILEAIKVDINPIKISLTNTIKISE